MCQSVRCRRTARPSPDKDSGLECALAASAADVVSMDAICSAVIFAGSNLNPSSQRGAGSGDMLATNPETPISLNYSLNRIRDPTII